MATEETSDQSISCVPPEPAVFGTKAVKVRSYQNLDNIKMEPTGLVRIQPFVYAHVH